MQEDKPVSSKLPMWFRIVSVVGILWYLFGFSQFLKNLTMDVENAVASGDITQAHAAAMATMPLLIWAAYFVACLLGVIGAFLLFRGKPSLAVKCFAISLLLDIVYFGWFHVSGAASARPTEAGPIAILVITVAAIFTLLSLYAAKKLKHPV